MSGELLAILELYEQAGIPAVPFKGPVLAVQAYGDVALREFRDLDILVTRGAIRPARELLLARGFSAESDPPWYWHQRLRRDDGLIVELHSEFAPPEFPYPIRAADVWSRLEPVRLGGRTVHSLTGEDLALLLCAHGAKHLWERRAWIGDIAALLARRPDLDWDSVLARARQSGAERIVLLALHLANELLGAPLPTTVAARVRADATVRSLGERVRARLSAAPQPPTTWETRAFYWRVRERWPDRLRDFARVLLTPRPVDLRVVELPNRLYALYYLIRPLRLAAKYGARLLRVVRVRSHGRVA